MTPELAGVAQAAGPVDEPLLETTIGAHLAGVVRRHAGEPALFACAQDVRMTFGELWAAAERCARGLWALGVRTGDRVAVWAPNRSEWVVTQYAAARLGAILVSVNPTYEAQELEWVLADSGASVLLLSAAVRDRDNRAVLDRMSTVPRTVVFERDWDALLARAADTPPGLLDETDPQLSPEQPISIQYTSGTTGRPKGVTLTHRNILNNAWAICATLDYRPGDRVCVPVPLFHCFGMVLGTLGAHAHGATVVLPGEVFDAGRVLAVVEQERCTALYGVPTMFLAELEHPDRDGFDLTSLRGGLIGGALCPPDAVAAIRDRLHIPGLSTVCGMTETSPISTQTRPDDPLDRRTTTVGRPVPHVEVKIVDPATGATVPPGTPGEQCTRGYSVMRGYWNNPAATDATIDADGWLHTGDLATMDEEGYVSIVGRIKDVIIRGGENIYPAEIENLLRTHPEVSDAYVIGVPDARFGEQLMAWVKLRDGGTAGADELRDFCRDRISRSKVPRHWKFVDGFPATASGKIQKFRMREIAAAEL